jgi:hypothetical protein
MGFLFTLMRVVEDVAGLAYGLLFGSMRALAWFVLAMVLFVFLHLAESGRDQAREQMTAHLVADAKAADDQARDARRASNQMRTEVQTATVATEQKVEDRHERVEAVVTGVRAGTVRVRERLTCPVAGAASVPDAASAAAAADGGATRGLSANDVQFLVRFAQRAGDVQDERNLGGDYARAVSRMGLAASSVAPGPASAAEGGSP